MTVFAAKAVGTGVLEGHWDHIIGAYVVFAVMIVGYGAILTYRSRGMST